jgi:pilus assembly protein Flp/PilA
MTMLHSSREMSMMIGREAATAIEYGLIAAGIAVAIIAVVQSLGTNLNLRRRLLRLLSLQLLEEAAPAQRAERRVRARCRRLARRRPGASPAGASIRCAQAGGGSFLVGLAHARE